MGDYKGDYVKWELWVMMGDTRNLDYSSCEVFAAHVL